MKSCLLIVCWLSIGVGISAAAGAAEKASMHPPFKLLDARGESVLKSGTPVSTMRTCGGCHDTQYIAEHTYHGGQGKQPKADMNCFLCHLPNPDNSARLDESRSGRSEWVATATLATTGVVKKTATGWKWNEAVVGPDGLIGTEFLRPVPPSSSNCGLCHGEVHKGSSPLVFRYGSGNRITEMTGQVFSSQRLKDSGVNLAGKDQLARPWDVHAERLMECRNCHYSLNNPAYVAGAEQAKPSHLRFESRKLTPGEFLLRPDHNFAKGHTPQGHAAKNPDGTMRRCESCHDAGASHAWLPYTQRHFDAMNCEACHVPQVYAPARQQVDATVVDVGGNPVTTYRGINGPMDKSTSLVSGYTPVLLPRQEMDRTLKLTPHNLVTSWYWVAGDASQRVDAADLKKAILDGSTYHADVIAALDGNHDGKIDSAELRLNTPQKVDAIRRRLEAIGLKNPRIVGTIQPYSLHHGVAAAQWATRECSACHSNLSRTSTPMELASYLPGGVMPVLAANVNVQLSGKLSRGASGELIYTPVPTNSGRYVIGYDQWLLGDVLGFLAVGMAGCGVAVHSGMRVLAARKRAKL